jgi:hypothetical protein
MPLRPLLIALLALAFAPAAVPAPVPAKPAPARPGGPVEPGPQAGTSALQPFPSNLLTAPDPTQLTGLRVNLPQPNCATNPSDCADVAVLNQLDGFNVQPRISIPFSGPIDVATVSSSTVYLRQVGCSLCHPIGINQVVWEPLTNTLHVESDQLLEQDTTYLLVVTTGVHDASGQPLERLNVLQGVARQLGNLAYLVQLQVQLALHRDLAQAAAASLFTTQSVTADMEKIRQQIDASTPAPVTILRNQPRAALTAIQWNEQTSTAPGFTNSFVPVPALDVFPGSVASIVWGTYSSPNYENASQEIPATPTGTGTPTPTGTNTLQFELFVPSGAKPPGGWPVAIFGHGFTDSKQGAPWVVASSLAHAGIATIAINVVGHGGGPLGTLTLLTTTGPVVIPDGGRGFDQNGDGKIDSTEGVNAAPPDTLVGNRDGLRQTVIDLMQLVREIQAGIDVDGDHVADLDASKITYAGQSFGGIYGVDFLALEPDVLAGVANVPGGPIVEIARLSPAFRGLVGLSLITRTPSLYNAAPNPGLTSFVENEPLRDLPPVTDTVPGASAIQELIDRDEWAQQAANPVALAPYVRREPLPGHPAKAVIIQFANGDMTVPNPTATALIRAGDLADRATYFRNDIAGPGGTRLYANPHTFLTGIAAGPVQAQVALEAQAQIATFLGGGGATTIDPDGPGPIFETPIVPPLPEGLGF